MHLLSYCDGKTDLIEMADRKDTSIFNFEEHINPLMNEKILGKKI